MKSLLIAAYFSKTSSVFTKEFPKGACSHINVSKSCWSNTCSAVIKHLAYVLSVADPFLRSPFIFLTRSSSLFADCCLLYSSLYHVYTPQCTQWTTSTSVQSLQRLVTSRFVFAWVGLSHPSAAPVGRLFRPQFCRRSLVFRITAEGGESR